MTEIIGWDSEVGADDLRADKLPQNFAATSLVTVAASASGQVLELSPLRVIRPDRIVCDRTQAASLTLDDVKIGTVSLNASTGKMPMDAFSPDAVDTSMRCTQTATPSLHIFFTVSNKTAAAITNVSIGVIGPSASS
jgi:hypothetical protein